MRIWYVPLFSMCLCQAKRYHISHRSKITSKVFLIVCCFQMLNCLLLRNFSDFWSKYCRQHYSIMHSVSSIKPCFACASDFNFFQFLYFLQFLIDILDYLPGLWVAALDLSTFTTRGRGPVKQVQATEKHNIHGRRRG